MNTKTTQANNNFEPTINRRQKGQKLNHQYLLFDMDGTLIDSMDEWYGLIAKFLEQHGGLISDQMRQEILRMRVSGVAQYMHENIMPEQTP